MKEKKWRDINQTKTKQNKNKNPMAFDGKLAFFSLFSLSIHCFAASFCFLFIKAFAFCALMIPPVVIHYHRAKFYFSLNTKQNDKIIIFSIHFGLGYGFFIPSNFVWKHIVTKQTFVLKFNYTFYWHNSMINPFDNDSSIR